MSNFTTLTKHPKTKEVKEADWLDGPHHYGVKFDGDETTYHGEEVEIIKDCATCDPIKWAKKLGEPGSTVPICEKHWQEQAQIGDRYELKGDRRRLIEMAREEGRQIGRNEILKEWRDSLKK